VSRLVRLIVLTSRSGLPHVSDRDVPARRGMENLEKVEGVLVTCPALLVLVLVPVQVQGLREWLTGDSPSAINTNCTDTTEYWELILPSSCSSFS
jgi:hypothetical protein